MSAADVSIFGGGADSATVPVTSDSGAGIGGSNVETPPDTGAEYSPETSTEIEGSEGVEQTEGQTEGQQKTQGQVTPAEKSAGQIRQLLKNMRDADPSPENTAVVKQLHQAYERAQAFQKEFPLGVRQARELNAVIQAHGGNVAGISETLASIAASDELLYAGDPRLMDNIVEDLKSSGNLEALGKLGPSFLEKLRSVDAPAYYKTLAPHFLAGINEVGLIGANGGGAINELINAYNSGDKPAMAKLLNGIVNWYNGLRETAGEVKGKPSQPQQEWEREKADFQTKQTQEKWGGVVSEAQKLNRTTLGGAFKGFIPKGLPAKTLTHIGNTALQMLSKELSQDSAYQSTVNSLKQRAISDPAVRQQLIDFHRNAVSTRAQHIVQETLDTLNIKRSNTPAQNRVAVGQIKSSNPATQGRQVPVNVPTKPKDLVWDDAIAKKIGGADSATLLIAGKGILKTAGGGYRLVSWRRN